MDHNPQKSHSKKYPRVHALGPADTQTNAPESCTGPLQTTTQSFHVNVIPKSLITVSEAGHMESETASLTESKCGNSSDMDMTTIGMGHEALATQA